MQDIDGFWSSVRELIQDVVFGNGFIALGVIIVIALVTIASRLTTAGRL